MEQLQKFLDGLNGKLCKTFIAGPGTGSMIDIQFGELLRREKPSKNNKLTDLQRNFQGEFCIFIQQANWIVKKNEKQICDNYDSNNIGGMMLKGLSELVNKRVVDSQLFEPDLSFQLSFEDGLEFHLTCVQDPDPYFHNYTFFDQEKAVTVDGNCYLDIEMD